MQHTPASYSGEHIVLTGPIRGSVTLDDGTTVDVTPEVIAVDSPERAAEVAHRIGQHWARPENVHPLQVETTEDGTVTVREYVYDDSHYQAAVAAKGA